MAARLNAAISNTHDLMICFSQHTTLVTSFLLEKIQAHNPQPGKVRARKKALPLDSVFV